MVVGLIRFGLGVFTVHKNLNRASPEKDFTREFTVKVDASIGRRPGLHQSLTKDNVGFRVKGFV